MEKARRSAARWAAIAIVLAGCLSLPSTNFVDRDALPTGYLGPGNVYRAWTDVGRLYVAVDERPGDRVVAIECQVRDGNLYLTALHASGGAGGRRVIQVDACVATRPPDWTERLYWLTSDPRYSLASSAYWSLEARDPPERVKVVLQAQAQARDAP